MVKTKDTIKENVKEIKDTTESIGKNSGEPLV
jgi:hypothetical protein